MSSAADTLAKLAREYRELREAGVGNPEAFKAKVRSLVKAGTTQAAVAAAFGVTAASISIMLNGKKGATAKAEHAKPKPEPKAAKARPGRGVITVTVDGREISGRPEDLKALLGI